MPYKDPAKRIAYRNAWAKKNREKCNRYNTTWQKGNPELKRVANRRHIGEVGTDKRAAYNEKRRVSRKRAILAELEASRKHRESLREFITRKAA